MARLLSAVVNSLANRVIDLSSCENAGMAMADHGLRVRLRGRGTSGRLLAALAVVLGAQALPGQVAAGDPGPIPQRAPLGVSYSGWKGGFTDVAQRLDTFRAVGFSLVTFIPAYAYVGRNRIDLASGPTPEELGRAVELALRGGQSVVIKPHLEPLLYMPGYQRALSDNHSWRAETGWRGFFDVDPMTDDYREGVVLSGLRVLGRVFERLGPEGARVPPVRFDLGAELMNSIVEFPGGWERLLGAARVEQRRLKLEGRVLLSHNFSHHFAILEDQVERMDPRARRALRRYIVGLDALAISQYMDLTVAVPVSERLPALARLPTADEVAEALRTHERDLRRVILQDGLGIRPAQVPPFHIGEFGVGSGGLRHPNLWGPLGTPEQEKARALEVARGHEGLIRYLSQPQGRTARSAVLWVTGTHFDVFGWRNPAWAIPAASAAISEYVKK